MDMVMHINMDISTITHIIMDMDMDTRVMEIS